jgi:GNAT superfamily N-acetyltransferase
MDPVAMFSEYVRERSGADVLFDPGKGWATWKLTDPDEVWIADIFVVPEHRLNGVGRSLVDKIVAAAKEIGAKRIAGAIDTRAANRTDAMRAFLAYGMEFDRIDGVMLRFTKEIV